MSENSNGNANSEFDADVESALQGSDADDSSFYDQLALQAYRDEADTTLPANTDPSVAHAVGSNPQEQAFRPLLGGAQ